MSFSKSFLLILAVPLCLGLQACSSVPEAPAQVAKAEPYEPPERTTGSNIAKRSKEPGTGVKVLSPEAMEAERNRISETFKSKGN
ncbi:hypothetical protein [Roseateles toxinivorans]|uniref:Lipoprotein n=1 Tax=Roseateles toxinivorans TaxID=270368 RepID=A0A4R6QU61_9BURK|nr:hypothetical protein [Roseateles toxinivorans]TDP74469.1 hypothetical protein DES47_101528 [Roseateles toxinivorans]